MDRRPTPRVLPAGDSITYGAGGHYFGYRGFLTDLASASGVELMLVGSQVDNLGVGLGHEGHPGWRSDELLASLPSWIEEQRPDVLLLHIGTNDIYQERSAGEAARNIDACLELWRRLRPEGLAVVATPGPFRSPKNQKALELAGLIRALVARRAAAGENVRLADTHAALAESAAGLPALLDDSAHPSDLGYYLMARAFLAAFSPSPLTPLPRGEGK